MEEISHMFLNHKPTKLILTDGALQVRDYDKVQEEDAYGIGAAALLPWSTFFREVNSGCSIMEISEKYDVTPDLIKYRIKITGAYRLFRARTGC